MVDASRVAFVLGALVLFASLATAGYGAYAKARDDCETTYSVDVDRLDADEAAPEGYERVRYEDLPRPERTAFDRLRDGAATGFADSSRVDGLDERVVVADDARYAVDSMGVADCAQPWLAPLVWGVGGSVVGAVVVLAAGGWRWHVRRTSGSGDA